MLDILLTIILIVLSAILSVGVKVWENRLQRNIDHLKVSCWLPSFEKEGDIPEIVWNITNAGRESAFIEEMIIYINSEGGKSSEVPLQAVDLTKEGIDTSTQSAELGSARSKKFSESRSDNYNPLDLPKSFLSITGSIKYLEVRDGIRRSWKASAKDVQKINQQMRDPAYHMRIHKEMAAKRKNHA